jgi:hypothetical protein
MKMNCLCPLKVAVGERVLRCATCGLEFAPSVYERPSSELRMTFEEENAFILANRGKVPAAFNPKCVDCVRFTENHGYTAACVACYSSKRPDAIANEHEALLLAQQRGCEGYRCQ